jgi:hypothetical protein
MYYLAFKAFLDEIARMGGDREAARAELVAVATQAVKELLGTATPLVIELAEPSEAVRVSQALTVVEQVREPATELAVEDARRLGAKVGDQVQIPIRYTFALALDKAEAAALEELSWLRDKLPLPMLVMELEEALGAALNEVVLRWFPAPEPKPGSLWALLRDGGGWLVGQIGSAGGVKLTIAAARLRYERASPHNGWVEAAIELALERDGALERWTFNYGGNDGVARHELAPLTGAEAGAAVTAALAALASEVAEGGTSSMSSTVACRALLSAAIKPPGADSLWRWCEARLRALLLGRRGTIDAGRRAITIALSEVFPPLLAVRGFGAAEVSVTLTDLETGEEVVVGVTLGALGWDDVALAGPDDGAEGELAAIVETWWQWFAVHLAHHLGGGPFDLAAPYLLYGMAGHFDLLELLAARMRYGPPPPVPVPPFAAEALSRAAATLRPASPELRGRAAAAVGEERLLGVFAAGPYAIVLSDDRRRDGPHADAQIGLLAPGVEGLCEVLRVDPGNPPTRAVVDGDAFAFRRFCEWLAGGLVRAGLDVDVEYLGEEEDGDEDEERERPAQMMLSEWLRFGLPDVGDRFLVDWRHQWHVVFAGTGIVECLGGILGAGGAWRDRLDGRDRGVWRAFLREVVDSRF